jgi:hypothetical protein
MDIRGLNFGRPHGGIMATMQMSPDEDEGKYASQMQFCLYILAFTIDG